MTTTFTALGVPDDLVAELSSQGIERPFPIQIMTIPDALAGDDVCGKAKTGSGKTLAFGLPALVNIGSAQAGRPRALVLVPTRELAAQVSDTLTPLAEIRGLRIHACYGGTQISSQVRSLRRGVDIIVGTPGRLIDLVDNNGLDLGGVHQLVLDEADRMCDMGFLPQVEWLLRKLPAERQTMLFSATLDGDVNGLVRRHMREPERHEVASEQVTVEEMQHRFVTVHERDKVKVTAAICRGAGKILIFTATKRGADRLSRDLNDEGVAAEAIHGDLRQQVRERALARFTDGDVPVLVATDVAARGLHIEGIDIVIHYDPPEEHKAYLHRSGRTARAGETGLAVTLVLWNQVPQVRRLQKRIGVRQPPVEMFSNDPRLADLAAWDPVAAAAVG